MEAWWRRWAPPWRFRAGAGPVVLLAMAVALGGAVSAAGQGTEAPRPRRFGVVGFYNPRLMYAKYQRLVDYLSEATGERWELVVTLNYEDTVQELCRDGLDVAYLGPFTELRARAACGARPVVRLNTRGSATYRSLIMVRRDSPVERLAQLAGRVFAFGSPLSTSSHLAPRLMLLEAGLHPGENLVCRYYGHHDRAAWAVLLGESDACGVRDIVGERFEARGLRVLARSDPLPNFPLVTSPGASADLRRELLEALVERPAHDPALRRRMGRWDEELAGGFVHADQEDYRPVMALVERVFGRMGLAAPPEALRCGGGR